MKLLKVTDTVVCVFTSVLCLSCNKYATRITAMLTVQLPFSMHIFSQMVWHRSNACKLTKTSHIGKGVYLQSVNRYSYALQPVLLQTIAA